mmetsp:Transcript_81948/g.129061  ORF Transcript_81948/g.129061 Transcript_81948/m.129061 type:complete len:137 (+) Transcript_81948:951-1361(+)
MSKQVHEHALRDAIRRCLFAIWPLSSGMVTTKAARCSRKLTMSWRMHGGCLQRPAASRATRVMALSSSREMHKLPRGQPETISLSSSSWRPNDAEPHDLRIRRACRNANEVFKLRIRSREAFTTSAKGKPCTNGSM